MLLEGYRLRMFEKKACRRKSGVKREANKGAGVIFITRNFKCVIFIRIFRIIESKGMT